MKSEEKNEKSNETNSIPSKSSHLFNLSEKLDFLKTSATIGKNYFELFQVLNKPEVQFYLSKRKSCKCILNALDCCLESLYTSKLSHSLIDNCCLNCIDYKFEYFDDNEGPKWFMDLLKFTHKYRFMNDFINASNSLRRPLVNLFLINLESDQCSCLDNNIECCIEKKFDEIYHANNISSLFKCCKNCGTKETEIAKTNNIFRQNSSEPSSPEIETILKNFKAENRVIEDLFENSTQMLESSNIAVIDDNKFKKINDLTVKLNKMPKPIQTNGNFLPQKSILKTLSIKKNPLGESKSKSVAFFLDPKLGFMPIPIPEWQISLREPLYSTKSSKSLPEWKFDISKNEYEFTKSLKGKNN